MPTEQPMPPEGENPAAPQDPMSAPPDAAAMGGNETMPAAPMGGPPSAEGGTPPVSGMPEGAEQDPEIAAHMPIAEVIVNLAHDYMIPMSEESLTEWVHHMVQEKATPEEAEKTFKPYAQQIAAALYPNFAEQIKKGVPVKTLVTPYSEVAKSMLGNDAQPDFQQPQWSAALDGGRDADGKPAPMAMQDWKKHIATHPSFGYKDTDHAKAKMHAVMEHLKGSFGGNE